MRLKIKISILVFSLLISSFSFAKGTLCSQKLKHLLRNFNTIFNMRDGRSFYFLITNKSSENFELDLKRKIKPMIAMVKNILKKSSKNREINQLILDMYQAKKENFFKLIFILIEKRNSKALVSKMNLKIVKKTISGNSAILKLMHNKKLIDLKAFKEKGCWKFSLSSKKLNLLMLSKQQKQTTRNLPSKSSSETCQPEPE